MFVPGGIDLDPCSSADANTRVGAARIITREAHGLDVRHEFCGKIFVNPPFGTRGGRSLQGLFFERCAHEYRAGRVTQAVVLLKAGVGFKWFREVMTWPVCFVWERLAFVRPASSELDDGELRWGAQAQNPHGSVVVYMGPEVGRFAELFGTIGSVPGANAWAYTPPCGAEGQAQV